MKKVPIYGFEIRETLTPEQRAAEHIFGDKNHVTHDPDLKWPNPHNLDGPRVSYADMVAHYRALERQGEEVT